jgi:hypothetical protein
MTKRVFAIVFSLFLTASLAGAEEIGGANLPDSLMAGNTKLILNGAGLRKKAVFIKVYAGGLYLQGKSTEAEKIIAADEPMAIRMHFIYDGVSSEKLIGAWNEGFEKATGGNLAPIKKQIDAFNALFTEEAKEGDIYDIVYTPDGGVSVTMKGVLKGTIKGLDFKKALFAIWLGDDPADSGLKKGMLGK